MAIIGWSWNASTGLLSGTAPFISATHKETVTLSVNASGFVVDGGQGLRDAGNFPLPTQPQASLVKDIYIRTRGGEDIIDLRAVDSTSFTMISPTGTHVTIDGDWGRDTIYGSQFSDKITGNSGRDTICGMAGDDKIEGGVGKDHIYGGLGADTIEGGLDDDVLLGEDGNDTIIGGGGNDLLDGGPGADTLDAKKNAIGNLRDNVYWDSSDTLIVNKVFLKDRLYQRSSGIMSPCDVVVDPGACDCETDYGDAPTTYGTFLIDNGARHEITASGPRLGMFIDAEFDGLPVSAIGDDTFGRDDEDGVIFLGGTVLGAGGTKTITVDVQNLLPTETAKLDAWVDFDGDGDFAGHPSDANNQIFTNRSVQPGLNTGLIFNVPFVGSRLGPTYARFRLSTAGGLGPQGLVIGGEVEDYRVDIGCNCAIAVAPGIVGYQCVTPAMASLVAQLGFLNSNIWDGTEPNTISFTGLSGLFSGETFAVSHGLHIENLRGPGAQPEGGPVVENLDAYDNSYYPDGDTVVASFPNNIDPPLTFRFDTPVSAVGSFLGTGVGGTINTVTIQAFDASDNLLASYQPSVFLNDDPQNNEGYWTVTSENVGISKITIKNDNPVAPANALIFDELKWLPFEPPITVTDLAADFNAVFSMSGEPIEVINFDDIVGPVSPTAYLASHDVTIEGAAQLNSLAEGSGPVGTVDGYDGTYEPDGNRLLVANNGDELSFVFHTPVSAVGMFLADEHDPSMDDEEYTGYTVRVFGTDGSVLNVINTSLWEFEDLRNDEGFVTFDEAQPIGKVTVIRNAGPANPFKIDNLTFTRPVVIALPGDYNVDGIVDAADHSVWKAQFGTSVGVPGSGADGNGDGVVNAADYVVWRNNVGATLPDVGGTRLAKAESYATANIAPPDVELVTATAVAPSSVNNTIGEDRGLVHAATLSVPFQFGRWLSPDVESRSVAPRVRVSAPQFSARTVDGAIELLLAEQIDRRLATRSEMTDPFALTGCAEESRPSTETDARDLALERIALSLSS